MPRPVAASMSTFGLIRPVWASSSSRSAERKTLAFSCVRSRLANTTVAFSSRRITSSSLAAGVVWIVTSPRWRNRSSAG